MEMKGDADDTGTNVTRTELWRYRQGSGTRQESDLVAREEPLEIRIRGESVAVTMRTPGDDVELAAGFLLSEGLIARRADVVEIAPCLQGPAEQMGNVINAFLAPNVAIDFNKLKRNVYTTSSCGLCGKASISALDQQFPLIDSTITADAAVLLALPGKMRAAQRAFGQTGGLHAAAIFEATGEFVAIREDVGRHNAVDKCLGFALFNGRLPMSRQVLLVSGRVSFEIMQKAWAGGIPMVVAVSAPSSLAIDCARESGQTLIGFARGEGMNVYTGHERVIGT